MTNEIEHLVFDIGNVLLNWDPDLIYRDQIPDDEERKWFLDNVCTGEWNLEQDRGRHWKEAEQFLISKYPEHETNIKLYRSNWITGIAGPIEGSVSLMRSLIHQGHDVTLLTNFSADTFDEALAKYPFLDDTRGATVSGRIGKIKPDAEIYLHHAKQFRLHPDTTFFVDDLPANVETAKNLGWQAVEFQDAKTLKADLERFGFDL